MITDEELAERMEAISRNFSSIILYASTQQDKIQTKTLDKITMIIRNATKEQLQSRHPRILVTCLLRLLLYYENVFQTNGFCDLWKRRRKFRIARDCYHALLKSYLPERSSDVVETIVEAIYQERLWKFETFCFEIMYSLLDINPVIAGLIVHSIWNKLTLPEIGVEDSRGIIRILYELLDVFVWPETQDTVATIEKMLGLFRASIIARLMTTSLLDSSSSLAPSPPPLPSPSPSTLASLKKGLEVCLRNTMKHISNDQLLVVVQHMCSWTVTAGTTDEFVLEFASLLEFAAFIHQANLYEQTLTPTIFPLLMRMVGSSSQIISLLGNRVLQWLIDRHDNRAIFDTPKIFFEHTYFGLRITQCRKEDRLFFKLHRELLHDSLLKSLTSHSNSRMNIEVTYCTICLIAIEVPCGFTAAALACLAMNVQEIILQQQDNRVEEACHIHATIISIMSFICWIHKAKIFYSYTNRIVMERAQWAPHLNPPIQSQYNFALHHVLWNKPELFFVDWEVRYGLWKCFRLTDIHNSSLIVGHIE
ncbi:Protein EFR3 like protein A [Trachymyrmex septentrionalis]|uniref:Protein EFR3 like protein A n=1 Tax=Trachymyrmex septentrionalis TaxID=34720 RepID=A0A195FEE3_9HYME|nr:PREDICTED: protein EFR3 homolog B-like [Trachymyrmex septentrionalis]KYN38773.1 Protein EFR3 like protein A [Trachymyrmex septentrionalis]